jgi:hypothetical protein
MNRQEHLRVLRVVSEYVQALDTVSEVELGHAVFRLYELEMGAPRIDTLLTIVFHPSVEAQRALDIIETVKCKLGKV